jgi:hypothetical protein
VSVGSEPGLLWLEISLDEDPSNILLIALSTEQGAKIDTLIVYCLRQRIQLLLQGNLELAPCLAL